MADGVLQYIGARYVPQFYLNSDGTPEWRAGVAFEPLTIVTYNNNSYTSRKPVPAEIGEPSLNPEYWAQTGVYNAQIVQLQNDVSELQIDVENLNKAIKWYTPEMYGAVGDNVTDDTAAFVQMFNEVPSDSAILCVGRYLITDQIVISKNNLKISGGFARAEYNPVIRFERTAPQTPDIYITGYGIGFSNIIFQGSGTGNNETLIELNAADNSGNIDAIFDSCGFFSAYRAVLVKGRNVLVTNSIFSTLTIAYDIEAITGLSTEYRGFIVQGCRVHSCNTLLRSVVAIAPTAKKGIAILNNYIDFTITIANAVSGGMEIIGNVYKKYDAGGGPAVLIQTNSLDTNYSYINVIASNVFEGNTTSGTRAIETQSAPAIVIDNVFNNFAGFAIGCAVAGKIIAKNNVFNDITGRCVEAAAPVTGIVKYNTGVNSGTFTATGATVSDNDSI